MKLTTHLHLEPGSRMHGAIPPLPQNTFMAWCSVKAQRQLYLYLYNAGFMFIVLIKAVQKFCEVVK
jgi:hypothetical protein